ncbi:MAG: alpha/beta hydrolase fold domain-containing protein [Prolixibacteraceae bacterium]
MNIRFVVLFLFIAVICKAREPDVFPRDTSFTLYSAFQKERKTYPFIQAIYPVVPPTIEVMPDLVYAKYGEREMHIDVYSPKNKKLDRPTLLFVFGGGWQSGNKIMEAPMAIHFAELGYATATVEYRLSPEALYPAAVFDIKTAIRWLRKNAQQLHIDTEKIAISGTSAGGQLAALVAATNCSDFSIDSTFYPEYSSDVQALIDIDGVLAFIHPESGEGADQPGKPSAATNWFGGNNEEKTALWNEASALNHVNKNMPPVLFINSQHPRFHAGRDDMIEILDSLGIYSEVHTLPNTPHPFWLFDPWFDPTVNWMEQFLEKHF